MWDFYPDIEDARAWYASAGLAHDFEHALRVLNLAMKIAENEAADLEIVYVAALLHDSRGATPGGEDGARMGHHLASAQFAGEILAQAGWKKSALRRCGTVFVPIAIGMMASNPKALRRNAFLMPINWMSLARLVWRVPSPMPPTPVSLFTPGLRSTFWILAKDSR